MTEPRRRAKTISWSDDDGDHNASFDEDDPELTKLAAKLVRENARNVRQRIDDPGAVMEHPSWRNHAHIQAVQRIGPVAGEHRRGSDGLELTEYRIRVWEPPQETP
jgi:hypothetical protein